MKFITKICEMCEQEYQGYKPITKQKHCKKCQRKIHAAYVKENNRKRLKILEEEAANILNCRNFIWCGFCVKPMFDCRAYHRSGQ
jgi:hypothetical protein